MQSLLGQNHILTATVNNLRTARDGFKTQCDAKENTINVLQGLLVEKTTALNRVKAMTKKLSDDVKDL